MTDVLNADADCYRWSPELLDALDREEEASRIAWENEQIELLQAIRDEPTAVVLHRMLLCGGCGHEFEETCHGSFMCRACTLAERARQAVLLVRHDTERQLVVAAPKPLVRMHSAEALEPPMKKAGSGGGIVQKIRRMFSEPTL